VLQVLMAVLLLVGSARFAGEVGARRYDALPDERARVEHESTTTRVFDWLIIANVAASAVNTALAAYVGSGLGVALSIGALLLSLGAWRLRQSARTNVNAGFAQRGLEPLHPRERSLRRERRQKQLAVIALTGYLAGRVLDVVAEQTDQPWLAAIAVLGMLAAGVAALGLVWSMAWSFGDERPA
jgi:hypothetical protein